MSKEQIIEEMAIDVMNTGLPLELAGAIAIDLYEKDYRKESEVAREIFEEIEKLFLNNHIESFKSISGIWNYKFKVDMLLELAKLKKKYIGE